MLDICDYWQMCFFRRYGFFVMFNYLITLAIYYYCITYHYLVTSDGREDVCQKFTKLCTSVKKVHSFAIMIL